MSSGEEDIELTPLRSMESDTGRGANSSDQSELTEIVVTPNNADESPTPDDLEELLQEAFKNNDNDTIKRILDEVNSTVSTRSAPTHSRIVQLAARHGSADILRRALPLGVGAPPTSLADREGRTPLHCAVWLGHKDCVSVLVKRCPHLVNQPVEAPNHQGTLERFAYRGTCLGVNVTDEIPPLEAGLTPLHVASQRADIGCVRLLLAERANCAALDNDNLTPLDTAGEKIPEDKYETSSERFLQVIKALCDKGSKPTTVPAAKYRQTPMHIAVRLKCEKAIPVLATAGYDKPIANSAGDTALHKVVVQRSKDQTTCPLITRLLLVYGEAGVEYKNKQGETSLHVAVKKEWLLAVQTLLEAGADTAAETNKGKTALHLAANNHVIMSELLKADSSSEIVNKLDSSENTPLFLSIHKQNHQCVSLLLTHGANVKQQDKNKRTVLHCAINNENTRILEALFAHDNDAMKEMINSDNGSKNTPLHIAVKINNHKGAMILVKQGCDLKKKDDKQLTAFQRATSEGRIEIVKMLSKFDPTLVHAADKDGMKPIHWACIRRNSKIITILVNAGSDLSAKCQKFETTAMDLLIHRVPYSVDLLKKSMDSSLKVKATSITIDYNILLPNESNDSNGGNNGQMKVLNALVQTGDQVNQKSLFTHPLIESFLHLQWKRMCRLYYFLIFAYMVVVISFSCLILIIFGSEEGQSCENPCYVHIFLRVLIAIGSSIHIPHEVVYICYKPRNSTSYCLPWSLSTLTKKMTMILHSLFSLAIIVFTFAIVSITVIDPTNTIVLPRELATGAVLLFWIEFMLLASRVPTYGFYMLMFFEVMGNFFVILSSFTFLIVAFMIAFFIEFQARPPFDTKSEAFLKTIVMMTNEFEYGELFNNFKGSMVVQVFTKVVFLLFVLIVGIVIMNILTAKAILDVNKVDRLRKKAEFLCTYEHVFDCLVCSRFKTAPLKPKLEIQFDLQDLQFPNKLMHTILDKAYALNDATKQQYKDEQMQNNVGRDNRFNSTAETKSSDIMEMNRKIDLLTQMIENLSKDINVHIRNTRGST